MSTAETGYTVSKTVRYSHPHACVCLYSPSYDGMSCLFSPAPDRLVLLLYSCSSPCYSCCAASCRRYCSLATPLPISLRIRDNGNEASNSNPWILFFIVAGLFWSGRLIHLLSGLRSDFRLMTSGEDIWFTTKAKTETWKGEKERHHLMSAGKRVINSYC